MVDSTSDNAIPDTLQQLSSPCSSGITQIHDKLLHRSWTNIIVVLFVLCMTFLTNVAATEQVRTVQFLLLPSNTNSLYNNSSTMTMSNSQFRYLSSENRLLENNNTNTTNNSTTNSTDAGKSHNPFISEIAGPLLLVTTILFFLSIAYVLVCLCLIRCGSVRFDPVHYPDGRVYFCLGVRCLSSWCYLPLCGGGGGGSSTQRGFDHTSALTNSELRSYPPPPPWLAGDHNDLISSMDDFGIYIPIFDRAGRKKALEALLDHPLLFYGDPSNPAGGGEVRPMVMRRLSSSQGQVDGQEDLNSDRMISVGRMHCYTTRDISQREINTTGSGLTKAQSHEYDIIMPPQDRPVDNTSSFIKKNTIIDGSSINPDDTNCERVSSDEKNCPMNSDEGSKDLSLDPLADDVDAFIDLRSITCPICLDDLDSSTAIIVSNPTVCNHTFHRDCLVEWLSNNHASCPCCRKDWVSNVMLWDALRWAVLKEQEEEREKKKEEKRQRRLLRKQSRRCIRGKKLCCGWCGDGHEPASAQSAGVIPSVNTSSVPDQGQRLVGDEESNIMPLRNEELLENHSTGHLISPQVASNDNVHVFREPSSGANDQALP